jgi:putative transposase
MPWKKCATIEERKKLVLAVLARREPVWRICRRFRISRQTAYKLRRRFLQIGGPGLPAQRRGPKGCRSYAERYRRWILAERRRRPTWGARKLLWGLRQRQPRRRLPSARTVARWLRAAGIVPIRRARHRIAPAALQPTRRARRSNEVWTFDWKGWVRTGDGAKIEPLTVRDLGSRLVLWVRPLRRRSDRAVRQVCRHLFRRYGRPKAIRTDLGGPFCSTGPYGLTTLSLWWYRLGIGVEFVQRGAGLDNNAHEQMHGVLQRETARPPAQTRQAQLTRLRRWQYDYNHTRPHDGVGRQPPARRYRPRPAKLPALLVPTYPARWKVRQVSHAGAISLCGQRHYIGRAFGAMAVGCKPIQRHHQIYFHRLLLATIRPALHATSATPRQT